MFLQFNANDMQSIKASLPDAGGKSGMYVCSIVCPGQTFRTPSWHGYPSILQGMEKQPDLQYSVVMKDHFLIRTHGWQAAGAGMSAAAT